MIDSFRKYKDVKLWLLRSESHNISAELCQAFKARSETVSGERWQQEYQLIRSD